MRYKPMIKRNANEVKSKRLQRQHDPSRQPQKPLLGWEPQLVDQHPKNHHRNGGCQNSCDVNARHMNGVSVPNPKSSATWPNDKTVRTSKPRSKPKRLPRFAAASG